LINNRQGGRRRGRGGQRGQNLGGQPGNRQDNRQRGNAAQLLEKYKSMARDAQLAGDRVQTEYLLQFADHYYRVLGESRARFEDQRPRRDQDMDEDAESSAPDSEHGFQQGDDEFAEANDGQARDSDERPQRAERPQRGERFNRQDRPRRPNDDDDQRSARPSRDGDDSDQMNGGETIPFDVLPPAIGRDETDGGDAEAAPKRPRRRARTPRPEEGEDEAAPAA
jgi:hypothetical protein